MKNSENTKQTKKVLAKHEKVVILQTFVIKSNEVCALRRSWGSAEWIFSNLIIPVRNSP